ncbi:MAG: histidine kinase [Bacteroidales bacterium]
MDSQRIAKVLTHPFFLGLVITLISMLSLMPEVPKYKADIIESKNILDNQSEFYSDLDNDQSSERIVSFNTKGVFNIQLYKGKGLIEQYNLRSWLFYLDDINTADCNNDGQKELILLTQRDDSIFLSIIDPLVKKRFIVKERLVFYNDTIQFKNDMPVGFFLGLNGSGSNSENDLVFALLSGFNKQPRTIFSYNIRDDELKVSPLSGASFYVPFFGDLNADSIPEIFISTRATGNYNSSFPYSDHSSWLMVLDRNLKYVFEPVGFPGYPASLVVSPYRENNRNYIVALHHYNGVDSIQSALYLFDQSGRKLLSRPMEQIEINCYYLSGTRLKGRPLISVLDANNSRISLRDKDLKEIRTYSIPELLNGVIMDQLDIDFDGVDESIFMGRNPGTFVIFREGLRNPVVVDLDESYHPTHFSQYFKEGIPYLHVEFSNRSYILKYKPDPFYFLKYPLLLVYFFAVSFVIFLIFRLQKFRAERDYQTKRKLNELQILSLKNQIDPHFTFNILNSIGSLYTRNSNPSLAYNVFVKYSNLLRFTINNSDQISIPIKDELDFVNNFVELEQFRCGNAFDYTVYIEDGVDLTRRIPRMLIHSFVENSIKHGVRFAEKNALLEVRITRNKNTHLILIRDNGPGLNSKTGIGVHSTGKGLKIVDEMLALFHQLEGIKITYTLEDISLKDPNRQGTLTSITIP